MQYFFLHYPTKDMISEKKYLTQNECFDFLYNFWRNTFSF